MERRKWDLYLHEILNGLTHGAGALLSIAGLVLLLVFTAKSPVGDAWKIVSFSIYGASLILMFTASTLYHSFQNKRIKAFMNALDHIAIYILIAGTYTPFALVSLRGPWGWSIFGVIWGLAIAGVVYRIFIFKPRYRKLLALIYSLMGWIIIVAIRPLIMEVPPGGLYWLAAGCLFYSIGIIFYLLGERKRYYHVVWHLFVLGGAISHFFAIYGYVLPG